MTGGDIAAVVDRRDVSVDDVTPARIFSRTNRCPDIHRERRSLIRRVRWLPGWVLIQRKLVSLRAMRNKAQPESTIITPRQRAPSSDAAPASRQNHQRKQDFAAARQRHGFPSAVLNHRGGGDAHGAVKQQRAAKHHGGDDVIVCGHVQH